MQVSYLSTFAIFVGGNEKNRFTAKEGKFERNRLGVFQW